MKIPFKCFLSIVLILIFNRSLLNTVKTAELQHTRPAEDGNKIGNSGEDQESKVRTESTSAEIHSSFSEDTVPNGDLPPARPNIEGDSIFKNIDVSPELSEASNINLISVNLIDTAGKLKNRAKSSFEDESQNGTKSQSFSHTEELYIVHAEPKAESERSFVEPNEKVVNESVTDLKSSHDELLKTAPQHEDIPSFREWTQKQLAEAERKKFDQNSTTERSTKSSGKFRIKNYASPDCGAKIVAANPESVSSSSVLSSSKDEYMLNYCTNRIWFVVELCEAIQAKQLDLANFELFSSSPKDFSVSVSHRFPTRDWSNVGRFTAKDSRDIQTFNLSPHLFGKYIKVELMSHYGREQFCPVSWVGVFGTSEFEVLAKEDDRHPTDDGDEDDEDLMIGQRRDTPKNLFVSATDAVLSIVKKATAPFMKTDNNETRSDNHTETRRNETQFCVTPRFITVCDNCSQSLYDEVYHTLSCHHLTLRELISCPFVKQTLINSESCQKFGLDFNSLRSGAPFPSNNIKKPKKNENYVTAMMKDSFVIALCNVLAVSENKVVVNATDDIMHSLKNLTEKKASCEPSEMTRCDCKKSSHSQSTKLNFFLTEILKPSERFSQKIEPTRTLNEDEIKGLPPSVEVPAPETTMPLETGKVTPTVTVSPTRSEPRETTEVVEEPKIPSEEEVILVEERSNSTSQDFDSILSDINEFEKAVQSSVVLPRVSDLPTESIFLRLANRIKNLEINMSLSSTYLEELSRRYRNQLEMLSKTINSTAQKIEEKYKLDEDRERLREKEMISLRLQLANLTRDMANFMKEKNSWRLRATSISQHVFLVSIEVVFIWVVFSCWRRSKEPEKVVTMKIEKKRVKRRKSLEGVTGHSLPIRRKRRPSDESLEITASRNRSLPSLKVDKKRKRKKKDSKSSMVTIHPRRKKSDSEPEEIVKAVSSQTDAFDPNNRFAPFASPEDKFSPPPFMRTAMSTRNSRQRLPIEESSQKQPLKSDPPPQPPPPLLREKKSSSASLKKYVKKFFDK